MRGCVLLLLLALPVVGAQIVPGYPLIPEPQPYPDCEVEGHLFATVDAALENLWFHNGTLYLTAFDDGLFAADPGGDVRHVAATPEHAQNPIPVDNDASFMGVTTVGDTLFVTQGQSVASPVEARILRFDTPGEPAFTVFAEGFDGLNGLAADPAGNLYTAHGFREGIYKIRPDGTWDLWLTAPGANGVVAHPDQQRLVYMAWPDTGARVVAVDFEDPGSTEVLFQFNALSSYAPASLDPTAPVVPNVVDDILVTPDGRVLVTAHERLLTLLGDPSTGEACVLFDEHRSAPTSVRMAHGFGPWDGHVFVTDNAGEVWAFDIGIPAPTAEPVAETSSQRQASAPGLGAAALLLVVAVAWRRAVV